MFCTNCGQQIIEGTSFCTKCGAGVNGQARPVAPATNRRKKFEVSKIILSVMYVIIGGIILGAAFIFGFAKNEQAGQLIRTIVNWLLGIAFGISVLGVIAGCISGIVLLISSGEAEPQDRSYYKRNALWCFLGPPLLIVCIIFGYVIVNVIANLAGLPTNIK